MFGFCRGGTRARIRRRHRLGIIQPHFFHELEKFQARHQAGEFLPFCRAYHIGVHVGFHRRLTADGAELPAQIGAVLPGGQLAAYPVPDLRRVDMRVQLVQGMERVQQSEGGLFPHPRHPGMLSLASPISAFRSMS